MTTINISELQERTRRAHEQQAAEVMDKLPELLHDAARNCKPWAIVTSFFVAPDLDPHAFNGKLADLPYAPKVVYDHLKEAGLNPGFFQCNSGGGFLPNGRPVQGTWYKLTANWENAPEDNALRCVYEAAVRARAQEIIDEIPHMVADASAGGHSWTPVYEFFTPLAPHPLAFDGNPENLKGVPRLLYEYLSTNNLAPRLPYTEGEGRLCCICGGRNYHVVAQWHRSAGTDAQPHPQDAEGNI